MSIGNNSKTRKKQRKPIPDVLARTLRFERERLVVELTDDREVSVPLNRFPTLLQAKPADRKAFHRLNGGAAFHWPKLDLDLSTGGLIAGLAERLPAPPKSKSRLTTARGAA